MYNVRLHKNNRSRRRLRVRKKIFGTGKRPRLSVFRSNKHIYAQIIDDIKGKTLVAVSDLGIQKGKKTKIQKAFEVGKKVAEAAKKVKIGTVVFDRGGYKYHGRVKNIAEGMREGGLKL